MPIRIEISASTLAELNEMLHALNNVGLATRQESLTLRDPMAFTSDVTPVQGLVSVEPMDMGDEADSAVAAIGGEDADEDAGDPMATLNPKKGRGRPRKSAPGGVPPIPPKPQPEPAVADALTPEAMRDEAIKVFATVFSKSAEAMQAVRDYQAEVNVRKFIEVPLDKAPAMWAKAMELKARFP
jgi:hypothetical protein